MISLQNVSFIGSSFVSFLSLIPVFIGIITGEQLLIINLFRMSYKTEGLKC